MRMRTQPMRMRVTELRVRDKQKVTAVFKSSFVRNVPLPQKSVKMYRIALGIAIHDHMSRTSLIGLRATHLNNNLLTERNAFHWSQNLS